MKTRKLSTLALVLSLCTSIGFGPAALAAGHSSFNADEIECTISAYYGIYSGVGENSSGNNGNGNSTVMPACSGYAANLTDIDKHELADGLASEIAVVGSSSFNDIIGHLSAEYRQSPDKREAIEELYKLTYEKVSAELEEIRERHPVITIIDDIFKVWTVVYVFGFGKGLWASRGSGLTGLARFRYVATSVSENLPRGRSAAIGIIGAGTAIGVLHVIYNSLETKKLDPSERLASTQSDIVTDLAQKAADRRDELKALTDDQLRADPAQYRHRLTEVDAELGSIEKEMGHLYTAAPQFRSRMKPIAMDMQTTRDTIATVSAKLDQMGAHNAPGPNPLP